MATDVTAAAAKPSRLPLLLVLLAVGLLAAIVGAYLDWMWWEVYSGIMITLVAFGLLVVGVIVAIIPVRLVRRTGLVILAVAIGLLLGQNLGPSREPLILHPEGTITVRFTSPVAGTASGPLICQNVASGTEFYVSGDPNVRLDTDRSFVSVSIDKGSRWERGSAPRANGIRFWIAVTPELVPAGGKPGTIGMEATPSSTIDARFANEGGTLTFANLAPMSGPDFTGESLDLAGTVEWSCGPSFSG